MVDVVQDRAPARRAQLDGEVRMGGMGLVAIIRTMAEERRLTCAVCNGVIGVYEPILVVGHESAPPTSLAREPLLRTNGCELVHAACARDA